MPLDVKICGLMTPEAVDAACKGAALGSSRRRAAMVGFVFFPPSPRSLSPAEAGPLMAGVAAGVAKVALTVDADDALLAAIVTQAKPDMIQLHGHETPERVAEVKARFGLEIIKAVAISSAEDLALARTYEGVADRLLFDAKPPKGASRPGGNALAFDWQLLADATWSLPWLLAGGIDIANVAQAARISGCPMVDVSSGVEGRPGVKSVAKIAAFLDHAASL